MARRYWLFKSEPDVYGYDHLVACPESTDHWDGVRNYQARNLMRDDMKVGDLAIFYHSNTKPPHAAGVIEVVREAYPDHTAWDSAQKYFDPKSSEDNPRWMMVDVRAVRKLERPVSLAEMKAEPALQEMRLVKRGNRLSVFEIEAHEFEHVLAMAKHPTP